MARTDAEQVAYSCKCQATFNTVTSDRKNMFSIYQDLRFNFPFFIVKIITLKAVFFYNTVSTITLFLLNKDV